MTSICSRPLFSLGLYAVKGSVRGCQSERLRVGVFTVAVGNAADPPFVLLESKRRAEDRGGAWRSGRRAEMHTNKVELLKL